MNTQTLAKDVRPILLGGIIQQDTLSLPILSGGFWIAPVSKILHRERSEPAVVERKT